MPSEGYNQFGTLLEYKDQPQSSHFDDREYRDEWQDAVYAEALVQFNRRGYDHITDFGCGSGYKLVKYFPPKSTIGVEVEPSLSYVRSKYAGREWRSGHDISQSLRDAQMIISSDVIEHLPDPCDLLRNFVKSPAEFFVISTPALDLLAERSMSPRLGPPANPSHIREWTTREFRSLVAEYLDVVDHRITNIEQCTQMVLARKK